MIIATETTNKSLRINLSDHVNLQAFVSAEKNAKLMRGPAFKRDLEAFICILASNISKALARPKGRQFDIDGSLMYLCVDLLDDASFYGEMGFYYAEEKFNSIDVGIRQYNILIKRLAEAIECEYLKSFYIRVKPSKEKEPSEFRETLKIGGIDVEMCVLRNCEIDEDGDIYPKVYFEFLNNDDPKAMCKLELIDGYGKAKSRPIVFQLSGIPRTKKSFFYEIDSASLGENSHALLGARIKISHRKVDVKNGKTITNVISDYDEIMLDCYLNPKKKSA
ncbi:MAG: hypothetical protein K6B65_03260 [Bacilli bacterium]|nr:hypothetical protein [Bacilli bacterium]